MDQKCQTSVLPKNNFEVHIDVLLKKSIIVRVAMQYHLLV